MNRRFLLSVLLLVTCALRAADARRPNILLIVGDDMGYADVGFHGCKDLSTPHLDALAASGVRFTNGYVSGPYCAPTRAGLLTGRYQQRFGFEFNGGGAGNGLPVTEVTIANRLKEAGYTTGAVGKWHLGASDAMHPQSRGFDEFFGFLGGAHSYFDRMGMLRGRKQIDELDYTTDAFGREAVAFIERHKAQPWFLYLAFNAVHTPMHATDDRLKKFTQITDEKRRTYAAMMYAMDENIGKVRQAVKQAGLEENTLVFFISDNGGPVMPGTTTNASRNTPLRGGKRTTLEGGIHVPFVMSWAGHIKPGGVFAHPAIQLDLTRTALVAAGLQVKPDWKLDGVDLLPFVTGAQSGAPHDVLYWRFGDQMAIRMGDYKLVRYDLNADTLTGKKQPVSQAKLYNLAADLGETKDLAGKETAKLKELQAKWDAWNATLVKPGAGFDYTDHDGDEPGAGGKKKKKARSE